MTPVQVKATCNDDEIVISGGYVAILPDDAKIVYAYTDFEENSYKISVQNYNLKKNGTAIVNVLCLKALDGVNAGIQGSTGQNNKENEKEASTNSPTSQSGTTVPAAIQKDVARTQNMDDALLIIDSNTDWSGAVQGSDFVMESIAGSGYETREVVFESGGIYSLSFQKIREDGKWTVYIAENGQISKEASTQADYGIVSFAGTCK